MKLRLRFPGLAVLGRPGILIRISALSVDVTPRLPIAFSQ